MMNFFKGKGRGRGKKQKGQGLAAAAESTVISPELLSILSNNSVPDDLKSIIEENHSLLELINSKIPLDTLVALYKQKPWIITPLLQANVSRAIRQGILSIETLARLNVDYSTKIPSNLEGAALSTAVKELIEDLEYVVVSPAM